MFPLRVSRKLEIVNLVLAEGGSPPFYRELEDTGALDGEQLRREHVGARVRVRAQARRWHRRALVPARLRLRVA